MRKLIAILAVAGLIFAFASCASAPPERYNTQRGAVIGAGAGALGGQLIGGNTEGTLIGAAVGTLLGSRAVVGTGAGPAHAVAAGCAAIGAGHRGHQKCDGKKNGDKAELKFCHGIIPPLPNSWRIDD